MAKPLTILKDRARPDWIAGIQTQDLIQLAEQRYQELLQHQTPQVLMVDRDPVQFLAGFVAACSAPCHLFLCNPDWTECEWQQVSQFVKPTIIWGEAKINVDSHASKSDLPDNLIMIPTGGTSGKIRFAMHTWETLTASAIGFQQYFGVDEVNSVCVLPLYHVSGLMQAVRSLISNGRLIVSTWKDLTPEFDPQDFFISLVPTQLQRLESQWHWLSRFRTILLGGAPAWNDLLIKARSHRLPIALTYGMTETASQIATLKPINFLNGEQNCGSVLPHAIVSIDSQTQKLTVAAKSLMLGYYPTLSDASYDPDDLGYFDDRQHLHIVGRSSSKIITGGENVFPAEVEAAIRATGLVSDVCVIGVDDAAWGQRVSAIYVPIDQTVTVEKLSIALSPRLVKFKQPKTWIKTDQIPRNAQGKINVDRIRQLVSDSLLETPGG